MSLPPGMGSGNGGGSSWPLRILYDSVYLAITLVGMPYLLFKMATKRRFRAGLLQRIGQVPRRPGDRPCLWVHGVSVGELLAASTFIELFRREHPDWDVVISTTTLAGHTVARSRYPRDYVLYYPLDFSRVVRRVLQRVRPTIVILIELEIWPNFLLAAREREIPVALLNGRISERSFRGYRFWRRFLMEAIRRISLFCVQNDQYASRLTSLGIPSDSIRVTGTMKYDTIVTEGVDVLQKDMSRILGIRPGSTVLIAGSTHAPEERIVLDIFRRLVDRDPNLILILAPRQLERIPEVEGEVRSAGFGVVRRSQVTSTTGPIGVKILLVDTMGELGKIYACGDIVFVGGSLVPHGGQNMMEPAGLGKAVLFGPHIENFQDSVDLLLQGGAAMTVTDAKDLERRLETLLADRESLVRMGTKARAIVRENQGASRRNLDILAERFQGFMNHPRNSDNPGVPLSGAIGGKHGESARIHTREI